MKIKVNYRLILLFFIWIAAGICSFTTAQASQTMSLNKKAIAVCLGKTQIFSVTGTDAKVKWSSSKKKVATVSKRGRVTGKHIGTAVITAKAGKTKRRCVVKVVAHDYDENGVCRLCNQKISEKVVYKNMVTNKSLFPEGSVWGPTVRYAWRGGTWGSGLGCVAFAFRVSDSAFGSLPGRTHKEFSKIKVGDIVRVNNNRHSLICLKHSGKKYVFAEGNVGGRVYWTTNYTLSWLKKNGTFVYTRYPAKSGS